jgi:hypothetical protein
MMEAHYTHSTLRERIAEHVFVGEALGTLWRLGIHDVEVLRSEFDAHGYDLVMARGQVVRHIQFKTGTPRDQLRFPWHACSPRNRAGASSGCGSIRISTWGPSSGSAGRRANLCLRSMVI